MRLTICFLFSLVLGALATVPAEAEFPIVIGGVGTEYGKDVVIDGEGNVIFVGYFSGTKDLDPGPGTVLVKSKGATDIFVAKYDPKGKLLWGFAVGGPGPDAPFGVKTDRAGNVYLIGYFSATADFDPGSGAAMLRSQGKQDVYVAKYDKNGRYLWAFGIGGPGADEGYDLSDAADGGVCVAGVFSGSVDFDPGLNEARRTSAGTLGAFAAKYDASGKYLWAHQFSNNESGRGVADGLGFQSLDTNFQAFPKGQSVAADPDGNCYFAGTFPGTIDFDAGPGVNALTASGSSDVYLTKYNAAGRHLWAIRIGGSETASAAYGGIAFANGHVYLTGSFQGRADFDPGPGEAVLSSNGGSDIFAVKFTLDGKYVLAFSAGGPGNDGGHRIAVGKSGEIVLGGWYQEAGTVNARAASEGGAILAWVAKYSANSRKLWAHTLGGAADGQRSFNVGTGLAIDASGSVLFGGRFVGVIEFGGKGSARATSDHDGDAFPTRYGPDGSLSR